METFIPAKREVSSRRNGYYQLSDFRDLLRTRRQMTEYKSVIDHILGFCGLANAFGPEQVMRQAILRTGCLIALALKLKQRYAMLCLPLQNRAKIERGSLFMILTTRPIRIVTLMKLGIIGLPKSGKTTLFEALTKTQTDPAQRRESRIGTVHVPDERVGVLSDMYKPRKTIYAQVEYLLPSPAEHAKESAREQSIWTQVRDCDALIHVVRNFKGYGAEPPAPEADLKAMDDELVFSDLVVAEKRLERLELDQKRGKKPDLEEYSLVKQCHEMLSTEKPLREVQELATAKILRGYAFLSAKPMLVVANNDDEDDARPHWLPADRGVVVRGKLEQELSQMDPEEAAAFLEDFGITTSAMDLVIARSYDLLGLISFFTVGEDEVRAWTIRRSTPAQEAAGAIHSDIQKGFIRAEVIAYDDLMAAGSYASARKAGTVRLEGKTYEVKNGDIINFRFNV